MTRINVGIPPANLHSKHLIAEHREIIRIPNKIKSGNFNMNDQPKKFKLGTGHVKFFYDKLEYLLNRYRLLYLECQKRGFNVQNYEDCWDNIPIDFMNDYTPSEQDISIIQERIEERLKNLKK